MHRPADTVVETERLWLREWRTDDRDALLAITTDPQMMRFIGDGRLWTDENRAFFIRREQKRFAEHGFCLWAAIHRESGELIGLSGLKHLGQTDMIEVGWWIVEKHWGQGLATEAGRAAIDMGFGPLGLERIVAIAHPRNAASIRVMKKLGMTFVRETPLADLGMDRDGSVALYEIFSKASIHG